MKLIFPHLARDHSQARELQPKIRLWVHPNIVQFIMLPLHVIDTENYHFNGSTNFYDMPLKHLKLYNKHGLDLLVRYTEKQQRFELTSGSFSIF